VPADLTLRRFIETPCARTVARRPEYFVSFAAKEDERIVMLNALNGHWAAFFFGYLS